MGTRVQGADLPGSRTHTLSGQGPMCRTALATDSDLVLQLLHLGKQSPRSRRNVANRQCLCA